jgi:hypothetical protein
MMHRNIMSLGKEEAAKREMVRLLFAAMEIASDSDGFWISQDQLKELRESTQQPFPQGTDLHTTSTQ